MDLAKAQIPVPQSPPKTMSTIKRLALTITAAVVLSGVFYACSKEFIVADDTQRDNILQLDNSWQYMENEYFSKDNVPPKFLRDSHGTLLHRAKERELNKRSTWEEQAKREGWNPPSGDSGDTVTENQPTNGSKNTPTDNSVGASQ